MMRLIKMNQPDEPKYTCPACGFRVFDHPFGSLQICPICKWKDDDMQFENPNLKGCSNADSLLEYQTKWLKNLPLSIKIKEAGVPATIYKRDKDWIPYQYYKKIETIAENEKDVLGRLEMDDQEKDMGAEKQPDDKVYQIYNDIFICYVVLSIHDMNTEALKRAIFLQWYATVQPYPVTGLKTLDPVFQNKALENLAEYLEKGQLDEEFVIMLFHYHKSNPSVFSTYEKNESFEKLFLNTQLTSKAYLILKQIDFNNRGQMGLYWQHILNQGSI